MSVQIFTIANILKLLFILIYALVMVMYLMFTKDINVCKKDRHEHDCSISGNHDLDCLSRYQICGISFYDPGDFGG